MMKIPSLLNTYKQVFGCVPAENLQNNYVVNSDMMDNTFTFQDYTSNPLDNIPYISLIQH